MFLKLSYVIILLILGYLSSNGYVSGSLRNTYKFPLPPINTETSNRENGPVIVDIEKYRPFAGNRNDHFDWNAMKKIMENQSCNMIFSPLSMKLAVLITAEAGDNGLQYETRKVLPLTLYADLFRRWRSLKERDDFKFNLGTKLYLTNKISRNLEFDKIAKTYYSAETEIVNFEKKEETAQLINKWCNSTTEGHITKIVTENDLEQSTGLIILNAMFLKADWRHPFFAQNTKDNTFNETPTISVNAKFMKRKGRYYYGKSDELEAELLRMPYANGTGFAFTLILPNLGIDLDKVIENINGSVFQSEQMKMSWQTVELQLPKFKFDTSLTLKATLENLGLGRLFTTALSKLTTENEQEQLKVDQVIQKSGIEVNEHGSTVYTATEVIMVLRMGTIRDDTIYFNVNRPFIFVIEDEKNGTILFMGKILNPSK